MMLINLMPNNFIGNGCGVLSSNNDKKLNTKNTKCKLNHKHCEMSQEKYNYCTMRRKWLHERTETEEIQKNINRTLPRRFSSPLLSDKEKCSQEMTTPVKGISSSLGADSVPNLRKRRMSLIFWTSEDEDCGDYNEILQDIDISSEEHVVRLVQAVKNHIGKKATSATDLAEVVQDVYRSIENQLRKKVVFHHVTAERSYEMMAEFEERFMQGIHQEVYDRINSEEAESDGILSEKIEDLFWVRAKHLAAKIDERDSVVWGHLDKAMLALAVLDFRQSATEKMECVMECSKRIFEVLRLYGRTEGADDFIPLLIYVVLQSNPAHLHTNVRYILQFSNTDRIMKGEEGYYFTNLCSVVSYIENLTAESLGMSEQEFEEHSHRFDQVHDLNLPPTRRRLSSFICDVYHKAAEAQVLQERQEKLWRSTNELLKQMEQLKDDLAAVRAESETNRIKVQEMMNIRFRDNPRSACPMCSSSNFI